MSPRVLGMVGRRDEWLPTGIFDCPWIAVIESRYRPEAVRRHRRRVDRGHRPPEEESVLELSTDIRASALTVLTMANSRAVSSRLSE